MKNPRLGWIVLTFLLLLIDAARRVGAASSTKNLYKTLGVSKDCSSSELKQAYRKLSLKHHPDKVPPEKRAEAEKKFKQINEAYQTLSDNDKRTLYDQYGEAGLNPNFQPGGGGFSSFGQQQGGQGPFHFFGSSGSDQNGGFSFGGDPSMFGGSGGGVGIDLTEILRNIMRGSADGGRQRQQPRGSSTTQSFTRDLTCSLEELAKGVTKKLRVKHPVSHNPFTNQQQMQERIYQVKLKPGWKAGTKIKYPAKDGFPAMTFVVQEKKHAFLERCGNDLRYRCKVTLKQSEKGVRIKIPLPDGEVIMLSTENEVPTKDGHTMTIPNKGMPIKGGPTRGDLIIEFHVATHGGTTPA